MTRRRKQSSMVRQAECAGAVACFAGAVPFSFPPFFPLSLTKWHARFTLPSLSLTPSIAIKDVAEVTSEFRRVPRWSCVFPTRHFFAQFFVGCVSLPPLCFGGTRTGGNPHPDLSSLVLFHRKLHHASSIVLHSKIVYIFEKQCYNILLGYFNMTIDFLFFKNP